MNGLLIAVLVLVSALLSPPLAKSESEQVSNLAQHFSAGAPRGDSHAVGGAEEDAHYSALKAAEEDNRRLLALCIMGTAILSLAFVLTILHKRGAPPESIVTGSGLVLVIFATVLVATLAKTDQQLTAPIGILGAIAGYLLGKTTKGIEATQRPEETAAKREEL